jgi:hypothetical protein
MNTKIGKILFALAMISLVPATAIADLDDGLVAFYPFNGNANDESGNGHHGFIVGSTIELTTDRYGESESAYWFDTFGDGNWMQIPHSPDFDMNPSMSYTAWINLEYHRDDENRTIISKYSAGAEHKCLGINKDVSPRHANLFLYPVFHPDFSPQYQGPKTAEEVPLNEWVHIATTYDGSVGKIYVDGELSGECNRSGNPGDANAFYRVGRSWNGKIDDLRIYNRALSGEEIEELYHDGQLFLVRPVNGEELPSVPVFAWDSEVHTIYGLYVYLPIMGSYYPIPSPLPIWTVDQGLDFALFASTWTSVDIGVWTPWFVVGVNTLTGDFDLAGPWWFRKVNP